MAGTHPFLTTLAGVLRSLDDDALAALANRGLLRRAQKDLEASPPEVIAVEADRVRVRVSDATVEIPALPSKSTCSCPAPAICRHILGALVFLRREPASDNSAACGVAAPPPSAPIASPDPAEFLGPLDNDALRAWAGKPALRKAEKFLATNPAVEIETSPALVIRFPQRNVAVRWIPTGGLEGLVCSCQSPPVCEHAVAAVMAFQASRGTREIRREAAALSESTGAPRTRAEVLESVAGVLREMVSLGLSRLSTATADRLTTLAISAHGVDLPRLERMLKGLADEVGLALRRDAQADSANLLVRAARVEALRTALSRNASPALVGEHRSQYHEVGQLTLVGLGAQWWRSKGGQHGLTLYFRDTTRNVWATWSESRPVGQAGFDPAGRFRSDGPWIGCAAPFEASRSVVRLTSAWSNPRGRISGRPATRALVVEPSRPRDLPGTISDWSAVARQAAQLYSGGLSAQTENLELVLLAPQSWGTPQFDPLRQELIRPIFDAKGRGLDLWIPFTPDQERAVDVLEQHDPSDTHGLLGAIRLVSSRLRVQPISLFVGDGIVSLNLDTVGAKGRASSSASRSKAREAAEAAAASVEGGDEPNEGEPRIDASATTGLGRLLIGALAELEAQAESGIAVRRDLTPLRDAAKRMDQLGLSACARPIERWLTSAESTSALAEPDARDAAAAHLLHAYHVARLAAEQETVVAASANIA